MKTQLTLCISGTLLLVGMSGCEKTPERPMNVVYILADDLGYGDVGCYGQQIIKTPNIDRMAKEGMLFTQPYAGCTVSAPSRCSLMTGLHTGHTQVRGNREITPEGQQPMREDTYTLGKLMKSAGYTTGIFGKWGLGNPGSVSIPNKMGFDEFYGYNCQRQSHSFYPDHLWHNEEKVLFPENENNACKTYSQDLIHEQALKFIRDHKEQPFFAMLTYTLPHAELNLPHDSIYKMYENSFEETPYIGKFDKVYGGYNTSEKPLASFAAMVSRLDKYVGDVMAELKELGLDKNTIVIFTSDNGPHHEGGADPDFFKSYGPFRGIKRDVYEGGIRIPMVAWCQKTVLDLIPEKYFRKGLFPAGRLDKDTTGMMIITDDGEFAHNILSPKKHIKKTYRVTIDIDIDENMIKQFEKGIVLKDHICCPAIIEVQDTHTAFVTITEGKYHQIKRMFGCFGAKVLELHRITMGNLNLPADISEGCCREITEQEMKLLKEV